MSSEINLPDGTMFVVGTISEFEELLRQCVHQSAQGLIAKKQHSSYFKDYFSRIKAQTIVLEKPYVDRDFLEDFAAYYVRCFENYERKCARMHFFAASFTTAELQAVLKGNAVDIAERLKTSYLGFVVIKPLPLTYFGRTCLTTKGSADTSVFPAGHPFKVSLFGIDLEVDQTLPFQEQDSVVAACATSALWSAFHGTGRIFQHAIPSPVEITKAATQQLPAESRALPNHGLHPHMMAQAIRSVGLEPHYVGTHRFEVLLGNAYAYLREGIPPVLGFKLHDKRKKLDDATGQVGKHAVAITGFNLGLPAARPIGTSGFLLRATRIDKLFVHDDGIGPYARMEMLNYSVGRDIEDDKGKRATIQIPAVGTSWLADDGSSGNVVALPEILMIPLYHKIRIPYEVAQKVVVEFDQICASLGKQTADVGLNERFEWDIYLTTVNEIKAELLTGKKIVGDRLEKLLTQQMPKFIWRASASNGTGAVFDLLFDATDIEHGLFVVRIIGYNDVLLAFLAEIAKGTDADLEKSFPRFARGRKILKAFMTQAAA